MARARLFARFASLAFVLAFAAPPAFAQEGDDDADLPTGPAADYSKKEQAALKVCVMLSDIVQTAAQKKQEGMSRAQVKAAFTNGGKLPEIVALAIDHAFDARSDSAAKVVQSFFGGCAGEVAEVPVARRHHANSCLGRAMLAGLAYDVRKGGLSRAQLSQKLDTFASGVPKEVADKVYASTGSRMETLTDEFVSCLGPTSD